MRTGGSDSTVANPPTQARGTGGLVAVRDRPAPAACRARGRAWFVDLDPPVSRRVDHPDRPVRPGDPPHSRTRRGRRREEPLRSARAAIPRPTSQSPVGGLHPGQPVAHGSRRVRAPRRPDRTPARGPAGVETRKPGATRQRCCDRHGDDGPGDALAPPERSRRLPPLSPLVRTRLSVPVTDSVTRRRRPNSPRHPLPSLVSTDPFGFRYVSHQRSSFIMRCTLFQ